MDVAAIFLDGLHVAQDPGRGITISSEPLSRDVEVFELHSSL